MALVYRNYSFNFDWEVQLASVALCGTILFFLRRQNTRLDKSLPWEKSVFKRFLAQMALNISISLFFAVVLRNFIEYFMHPKNFIRFSDELLITSVLVILTSVVVMIDLGIFLATRWKESSTEAERFRKENMEFRFEMLKNQVNPHFLFNSLNTLASLVYESQEIASQFVRELSKVYRYVLENKEKELISLKDELHFLEAYVYLIKIRFSKGLDIEINIPDAFLSKMIPPMTIQLLIENALKHNIVSASKPLKVVVSIHENGYLAVHNNLQKKIKPEHSTHTGLDNIKNRFAYLSEKGIEVKEGQDFFRVLVPLLDSEK